MHETYFIRFIDASALLMLVLAFAMLLSRKMLVNIKLLSVQAILLALLAFILAVYSGHDELFIAAVLTLGIKAFLIPRYLTKTVFKTERFRETSLFINLRSTLVIAFVLVVTAYHFAGPLVLTAKITARNVLPVALSLIMLGMLLMVVRKKIISHIIGLMQMENGIYLLAVAATGGMPLIVEIGVFIDILIAVIIMAAFSERIGAAFSSLDSDNLRKLRG